MATLNTTIVSPARVESWKRKHIKQHLLSSPWDQFSNRATYNETVPHSKDKMIPKTIVHKVTDEFRDGEYRTTCLWVGKPNQAVIGGPNKAEGNERAATTKHFTLHYNVQRFPMKVSSRTVGGRTNQFWKIAEGVADIINDIFVEQTDYDCERSLLEGNDVFLSNATYWESSEYGSEISAPLSDVLL